VLVVACAAVVGLSRAAPSALPRATADRPDEVVGEQVHFLYVLPTDAPDEELDVNGLLTASIARTQAWLAQQSGGPKLRTDTFQGQPDITFVRTSLSPPDAFSEGLVVRRFVEQLGFAHPKKVYLAYLGAFEASSCGLADRGGKGWARLAHLRPRASDHRSIQSDRLRCDARDPPCPRRGRRVCPNTLLGHVVDRRDIMNYDGTRPDENGQVTVQLDPGRDQYWGTRSLVARMSLIATSWTRTRRLAGAGPRS
jgi:hypothetical protein